MITSEKFLLDVAKHEMIILRDDGVYRHIRFKRPGSGNMYFDIVTWPGYLAYSGDMGCYVFSRLNDMFCFFRPDECTKKTYPDRELHINLGYWSEKLQAVDGNRRGGSAKEFSSEKFKQIIKEILIEWIRESYHDTTKEQRRELWEAVDYNVMSIADDTGVRAYDAANEFEYQINNKNFRFQDIWEYDFTVYTYHFIWCCYALAWGINKYDELKEAVHDELPEVLT